MKKDYEMQDINEKEGSWFDVFRWCYNGNWQ